MNFHPFEKNAVHRDPPHGLQSDIYREAPDTLENRFWRVKDTSATHPASFFHPHSWSGLVQETQPRMAYQGTCSKPPGNFALKQHQGRSSSVKQDAVLLN
jgi:hypothetical protein